MSTLTKNEFNVYLNVVIIPWFVTHDLSSEFLRPFQITTEDIFQRTLTQVDQCAKWSIGRTPTDQRFSERFFFWDEVRGPFPQLPLTKGP